MRYNNDSVIYDDPNIPYDGGAIYSLTDNISSIDINGVKIFYILNDIVSKNDTISANSSSVINDSFNINENPALIAFAYFLYEALGTSDNISNIAITSNYTDTLSKLEEYDDIGEMFEEFINNMSITEIQKGNVVITLGDTLNIRDGENYIYDDGDIYDSGKLYNGTQYLSSNVGAVINETFDIDDSRLLNVGYTYQDDLGIDDGLAPYTIGAVLKDYIISEDKKIGLCINGIIIYYDAETNVITSYNLESDVVSNYNIETGITTTYTIDTNIIYCNN